jgi:hypothetical protein
MAMSWLRRNRKVLMGILVVALMVAWGALPALKYLATGSGPTRGRIRGEPVGPRELQQASNQLSSLTRFGLLQRNSGIGGFIFAGQQSRGAGVEAVWRYLVLAREAEAADIRVLNEELQGLFGPESPLPRGDRSLRRGLVNLIRISKLFAFRMDTVHTGTVEQWMEYYHQNYEAKLRLVEFQPEIFEPVIGITQQEVREFYDERREQSPDPRTGTPGYLAPERVRLEYAFAPVEDYKEKVSVSEEEIEQYYQDNKADYEIEEPEEPEEEPPTEEEEETGESPQQTEGQEVTEAEEEEGTEGEDNPDNPGAESEADPDEETAAESPAESDHGDESGEEKTPEEEGPQYQPLEDVREEIRGELLQQKAERMASDQLEKVLDDLEAASSDYVNEPLPLQQMAKRHGLRYARPTAGNGRRFLSRSEIRSAVPGGSQVAGRIFDEELQINFTFQVETGEGPLVGQVLERREAQPETFEAVKDRVERDLRRHRSMAKARTLAGKLKKNAAETSLDQAVAEMNERLVNLLGPPPKEENPENETGEAPESGEEGEEPAEEGAEKTDGGEAEEADGEEEEQDSGEPAYLAVHETDFVSLSQPRIEALDTRRPTVVREALTVPEGEMAVVVEDPPDPACYLIEKLQGREADPAGFWMWMQQQQFRTMFVGPQRELQSWLDGLLEESPPPADEEK